VAFSGGYKMISRDDVFTIVFVDDQGPYELPVFNMNDLGVWTRTPSMKRWHVVLFKDSLVWFQHDWFQRAELLKDVV